MVLDLVLITAVAFVLIVIGSYIGATMALNTFFGRDTDPAEIERNDSPATGSHDKQ